MVNWLNTASQESRSTLRRAITGAGSSVPPGTSFAQCNEMASLGLQVINCLNISNIFIISNSLASTAVEDFSRNFCQSHCQDGGERRNLEEISLNMHNTARKPTAVITHLDSETSFPFSSHSTWLKHRFIKKLFVRLNQIATQLSAFADFITRIKQQSVGVNTHLQIFKRSMPLGTGQSSWLGKKKQT